MLRQSCTNAFASSSKAGLVRGAESSSLTLDLPSATLLGRLAHHAQHAAAQEKEKERIQRQIAARQLKRKLAQPLARRALPDDASSPVRANPSDSPTSRLPLVTAQLPSSDTRSPSTDAVVHLAQPSTMTTGAAEVRTREPKAKGPNNKDPNLVRTVADMDRFFNFTDDQIMSISNRYPKKVLKDNPSFETIKKRVLKLRFAEALAKLANNSKAGEQKQGAEGSWKRLMGLRGVPVISKYPTSDHPTTATGIWGVRQTSEILDGETLPPISSWVGPTAVRSDIVRTSSRSTLYIQFVRRMCTAAKGRSTSGPTLPPSSRQLPHIPPSFLPEPVSKPIYSITAFPPSPHSTTLAARRNHFLTRHEPEPRWKRIRYEVTRPYLDECRRLAEKERIPADTRFQLDLYLNRKLRKAGLMAQQEGTDPEVIGKLWTRRMKTERVVVECDVRGGKKAIHMLATRRKKASSKLKEALRLVLLTEHEKGAQSNLDWRGWTYELRPTGQLSQVPMDVLAEFVRRSLLRLCPKEQVRSSPQPRLQQASAARTPAPHFDGRRATGGDFARPGPRGGYRTQGARMVNDSRTGPATSSQAPRWLGGAGER